MKSVTICFLTLKPQNRTKTLVITMFLQYPKSKRRKKTAICHTFTTQHVRNGVFYNLLDHLLKNTGIYSVLASEASQNKEAPPPFHILNFKVFTKSKTWQFLGLKTCKFLHQKNATSKIIKNSPKKTVFLLVFSSLGSRPSPQTSPSQGPFLMVFVMFYAHRAFFKKKNRFFGCGGGGWRHMARPHIATPHAMRSNMPGIRCLVHRRRRPEQISWGGDTQVHNRIRYSWFTLP